MKIGLKILGAHRCMIQPVGSINSSSVAETSIHCFSYSRYQKSSDNMFNKSTNKSLFKLSSRKIVIKHTKEKKPDFKKKLAEGPSFKDFVIASNIKSMYRESLKECSKIIDQQTRSDMKTYLRTEFDAVKNISYNTANREYLMATFRQKINLFKGMLAQAK